MQDNTTPYTPFTQIPNHVLEALYSFKCGNTQKNLLLAIARFTYGFHRDAHPCGLSYLAKMIGSTKNNVGRELADLLEKQVVIEVSPATRTKPRILRINGNVSRWRETSDSRTGTCLSDTLPSDHLNKVHPVSGRDEQEADASLNALENLSEVQSPFNTADSATQGNTNTPAESSDDTTLLSSTTTIEKPWLHKY